MKEKRYFYVPRAAKENFISGDEAVHISRVLRLRAGDDIYIIDGEGHLYEARLTEVSVKRCSYEITKASEIDKSWTGRIHLAVSPTKARERIEWMVEKVTEIGFDEITFLDCEHSERNVIRTDRIEKIVVAAMKQSHKTWKPTVNEITSFTDFIANHDEGRKYIAHCIEGMPRGDLFSLLSSGSKEDVIIMIGPEGDFADAEVEAARAKGYIPVTLGASRLRTETAGLYAVMAAQLVLRKE